MNPRHVAIVGLVTAAFALSGCGKKDSADNHKGHAHDDHAHEESATAGLLQTTFKEGTGLTFPEETKKALALTTVEAQEQPIAVAIPLTVQVFDNRSDTLATVSVPKATADLIAEKPITGARLVRVDRGAASISGEADLILALETKHNVGDFVPVTLTSGDPVPGVVVPRSALLRTTEGTYVYVANGASFLRTPVKVGRTAQDKIEIADGLYAGDVVVAKPVEQLWLSELRFTKGGGHSH